MVVLLDEGLLKVTDKVKDSFYVLLDKVETQLYYDGGPAGSFKFLGKSSESGGIVDYVLEFCGRGSGPKSLSELQKEGYSWYNRNVSVKVIERSGFDCFVATSAFEGASDDPTVQKLRDYRDQVMEHILLGRAFIYAYYDMGIGAKAAGVLDKIPRLKPHVRTGLEYLVQKIVEPRLRARATIEQQYAA